ncbi:MAG: hypothetical protein MJ185_11135, partial [Treponema sp.]|nr:hypothetical protein [Treponema sp.]
MQGICFFIAFLILITKSLCATRKTAIFLLEVSAVLYLGAPIIHLTYEGVPGATARWFLNISKFVDYLSPSLMLLSFSLYLRDLLSHKTEASKRNKFLLASAELVLLIGVILLIISRFTGWY